MINCYKLSCSELNLLGSHDCFDSGFLDLDVDDVLSTKVFN